MNAIILLFVFFLLLIISPLFEQFPKLFPSFIHIIRYSKKQFYVVLLFIVTLLLLFLDWQFQPHWLVTFRKELWGETLSHYVSFGTFLAAFAAWFSALYLNWKNSLSKRLSVYYEYNGAIIMQCNYAHLAGESDIRALAQQIGTQIAANDRNLHFTAPDIYSEETDVIYSKRQLGCKELEKELLFPFRHYVVLYQLNKIPPALIDQKESLIWNPPFNTILSDRNGDKPTEDLIKYNATEPLPQNRLEHHKFVRYFWQQIRKNNGYCSNRHLIKSNTRHGE